MHLIQYRCINLNNLKLARFFYGLQKYIALLIIVAIIRNYWESGMTTFGFFLFQIWLFAIGAISIIGYIYLYSKKIRYMAPTFYEYAIILVGIVLTCLVFEFFKV